MTRIIAHRGLHIEHPENSLPAFAAAIEAGIDWLECDVHASSDGEPIVMHDSTLDRTSTGGPSGLAMYTARELTQLKLKLASGDVTEARIPTLAELVEQFSQRAGLLVEIKPHDAKLFVRRVIEVLKPAKHCIIQSFDAPNVRHARDAGAANVALLIGNEKDPAVVASEKWPAVNVFHKMLNRDIVARLRDSGASVGAWTVTEEPDIRRMLDLGIDAMTSDNPVLARNLATRVL